MGAYYSHFCMASCHTSGRTQFSLDMKETQTWRRDRDLDGWTRDGGLER